MKSNLTIGIIYSVIKLLYFTALMLFVACGSDYDSAADEVVIDIEEGAITALAATGYVAQQTPEK